MSEPRPEAPLSELNAAAGDDATAKEAVGDFHAEYASAAPDAGKLEAHAARVRASSIPNLVATFERWWLDPHTQAFIDELGATGI